MADIKHYLLRYSFNQMEKGYGEEAKNVLRYISLYISEGISLPEDINNYLDAFEGTYLYTNGNTSFRMVLVKKVQQYNGRYYEDLIIGEGKV